MQPSDDAIRRAAELLGANPVELAKTLGRELPDTGEDDVPATARAMFDAYERGRSIECEIYEQIAAQLGGERRILDTGHDEYDQSIEVRTPDDQRLTADEKAWIRETFGFAVVWNDERSMRPATEDYHDTIRQFMIKLGCDLEAVKAECAQTPPTPMSDVLMRLVERRNDWLPAGEVPTAPGAYLTLRDGKYSVLEIPEPMEREDSAAWRYLAKARWLPLPPPPNDDEAK